MFLARLLLKDSHLDGCALNNLPLCHFSCFTSTRADNSADGIKSSSVLRAEWSTEGLGQTETLFTRASVENSSGLLNPKHSSQCKGILTAQRKGKGGTPPNMVPMPAWTTCQFEARVG